MKHTLRTFVAFLLALCLCLTFAGCSETGIVSGGGSESGDSPSAHTHTYATTWSSDESGHWHAATCEHTSERKDESAHTYQGGKCEICNYEHKAHAFGAYSKTENGHSQTCSVCGKTVTAEHSYEDGVCKECEYEHGDHTFGEYTKTESGHSHACLDCGKTVSSAHTYENGVCKECEYEHQDHTFNEYSKTEDGHSQTCSVCGKVSAERHTYEKGVCKTCGYAHQNHTYGNNNTCSVCGAGLYTKSTDGTKIYFGSYPQTEVTESSLKSMLGKEAGANPTSANKGKWTDYGYFIDGSVSSYMWYIDVNYQGSRYRGVYFTSYRPIYTTYNSSTDNSMQDDNGYNTNTVYWFKWEPIEWRVLEQKDGTALLMASIILDSQQYYRAYSGTRTIADITIFNNNYKESDIRAWLTKTFYETAFDSYTKKIVETTTVNNGKSSTASRYNTYVCEDTQDKVFLLSDQDVRNASYGFSDYTALRLKSTDYAKSQGVFVYTGDYAGNGWWWLRSPNEDRSAAANNISGYGNPGRSGSFADVNGTAGGVVPALWIKL